MGLFPPRASSRSTSFPLSSVLSWAFFRTLLIRSEPKARRGRRLKKHQTRTRHEEDRTDPEAVWLLPLRKSTMSRMPFYWQFFRNNIKKNWYQASKRAGYSDYFLCRPTMVFQLSCALGPSHYTRLPGCPLLLCHVDTAPGNSHAVCNRVTGISLSESYERWDLPFVKSSRSSAYS